MLIVWKGDMMLINTNHDCIFFSMTERKSPLKDRIWEALGENPKSSTQLAEELGTSSGSVRTTIGIMKTDGCRIDVVNRGRELGQGYVRGNPNGEE